MESLPTFPVPHWAVTVNTDPPSPPAYYLYEDLARARFTKIPTQPGWGVGLWRRAGDEFVLVERRG